MIISLHEIVLFFSILVVGEVVSNLIFFLLIRLMRRGKMSFASAVRGTFERLFLFFSMILGIFHALTLFGALKIATHIRDDDKVTNDYFLIGNLISVSMAIGYLKLYEIFLLEIHNL